LLTLYLQGYDKKSKEKVKPVSTKKKAKDIDLIHKDFVLYEALNLLKGIGFISLPYETLIHDS